MSSTADFETWHINLEFGHTARWGNNTTYRLHGGVQYFDLDHHLRTIRTFTSNQGGIDNLNQYSDFQGLGPRFGLDASYDMGDHFSLVGHSSAVLLIGDLDSGTTMRRTTFVTPIVIINSPNTVQGSTGHQVVPGTEGKVALRYDHQMVGFLTGVNGTLSLEGGWRWNWWHNVIEHRPTLHSAPIAGVAGNVFKYTSDYAQHGPYLRVGWTA